MQMTDVWRECRLALFTWAKEAVHVFLSDHVDGYYVDMERTFLDWLLACMAVVYGALIPYQMLCQSLSYILSKSSQ